MSGFVAGDRVVIAREARYGGRHSLVETSVEKVGKRDIVLANGERFNVARPSKSNGTWGTPTILLHADDERAMRLRREVNEATRRHRAASRVEEARKLIQDGNIADAKHALQAAIDTLDGKR